MMIQKKTRHFRLFIVTIIAVTFWTVGSGFYRNISADSEETYKGLKIFSDVIELIEKNYVDPVDTDQLVQKAIQGMVRSLDPHSSLLPPEAFEELKVDTQGEFGGIGIVITIQNGILTVVSPIEGTPAYKAGIMAGDKIIKVDGESTQEMELWEAVKKMRGPEGASVLITIIREGVPEPMDFTLIRDIIPIESVRAITLKPGYGYVRITNFNDSTSQDLAAVLENLESGEVPLKGLILDLRDNPGGLLPQAIQVSDFFLEEGKILSIKGRLKKHQKIFRAHPDEKKRDYPMIVLINSGSASASEIVAGALQDNHRALILGVTSFGKGTVQTVESLRDGYGLKLTIARYYTPSGKSIQAKGIVPDIEVKYRFMEEEGINEEREDVLKEKDLKNHLDATPHLKKGDETKPEEKKEETRKSRMPGAEYSYGPLKLENLQKDNQINRAIEILTSYEIFKAINS
jgi:carboxyl-terminal processing protease